MSNPDIFRFATRQHPDLANYGTPIPVTPPQQNISIEAAHQIRLDQHYHNEEWIADEPNSLYETYTQEEWLAGYGRATTTTGDQPYFSPSMLVGMRNDRFDKSEIVVDPINEGQLNRAGWYEMLTPEGEVILVPISYSNSTSSPLPTPPTEYRG